MSFVLWCPKHECEIVRRINRYGLFGSSQSWKHREDNNCLADFEIREVKP